MEKLNEQQQKLVTEYSYIIDKYMAENNLTYDGVTDYYGLFADSLCRASLSYDWRKGSFLNYIDKCFWRVLQNQECYENRKCRKTSEIIGIDELDENDLHYISDDVDCTDIFIESYDDGNIDKFYQNLTDREKQVFDCLFNKGLSQIDTSKKIGITKQNVWEAKNEIIHKYYKYIKNYNIL